MASSTITRKKCGQIYILSNDNFTLICEFCERGFFDLEAFRTHVSDHFPVNPAAIKIEDFGSDIKQENQDDIVENLRSDVASLAECQLFEDESAGPSNKPEEDTQADEQNEEMNDRSKPSKTLDRQPNNENENENTTNVKVKKIPLRRSTRKTIEPRTVESVPQHDEFETVINETIDSNEPNISSASATSVAANNSKPIRKKGFQCTFCPKIFRQRRDHAEHENIHTGRQPYKCPICFKTFARAHSLHIHNSVHTDKCSLYECSRCDKKFKKTSELNCHIRENHLPDTDPRRYFSCKRCDMKFDSKAQLTCHRTSKHKRNDTNVYICDYCKRKFHIKKNLFDHMNKHSHAKLFSCQFCNKTFPYRNSKSKHERTQHRDIAF